MTDFTSDEILELRRGIIHDQFVEATGSSPRIALSDYNRAKTANFVSDDALNDMKRRNELQYGEGLLGVYEAELERQQRNGADSTTAANNAALAQKYALYGLIQSDVYELYWSDPGFLASLADDDKRVAAMFKMWVRKIDANRSLPARRGGPRGTPRLVRR